MHTFHSRRSIRPRPHASPPLLCLPITHARSRDLRTPQCPCAVSVTNGAVYLLRPGTIRLCSRPECVRMGMKALSCRRDLVMSALGHLNLPFGPVVRSKLWLHGGSKIILLGELADSPWRRAMTYGWMNFQMACISVGVETYATQRADESTGSVFAVTLSSHPSATTGAVAVHSPH